MAKRMSLFKKFKAKTTLAAKLKNNLSIDGLLQLCDVLSINDEITDPICCKYIKIGRVHELLFSVEGIMLVAISFTEKPSNNFYNIKVTITYNPTKNDSVVYTVLFKDIIDRNNVYDADNTAFNRIGGIDNLIQLIHQSIKATISYISKWER